jgi:hypothetical protein
MGTASGFAGGKSTGVLLRRTAGHRQVKLTARGAAAGRQLSRQAVRYARSAAGDTGAVLRLTLQDRAARLLAGAQHYNVWIERNPAMSAGTTCGWSGSLEETGESD